MRNIFTRLLAVIICLTTFVKASNGQGQALYGLTEYGGTYGNGTLFEYTPSTKTFTKRIDFNSVNGANPYGSLTLAGDGKLYGLTFYGGVSDSGVLFVYDPATDSLTKKVDLNNTTGALPYDGLTLAANNKLYGLTGYGGTNNAGTLFEYDPTTGVFTKLYDFDTISGYPVGNLTQSGNSLFGVSTGGSVDGNGVIFQFNLSNDSFKVAYVFNDTLGEDPTASLTLAANGKLYGSTYNGGNDSMGDLNEHGVLFELDPVTYNYKNLYDFNNDTFGIWPAGAVLQIPNGLLYGMTPDGGTHKYGVIYAFDTSLNQYAAKYNFDSTNGGVPTGSLVYSAADGLLYGMTAEGGNSNTGVIFSYNYHTDSLTKLADLNDSTGNMPAGDLVLVNITTGISAIANSQIITYPNPATNALVVEGTGLQTGSPIKIKGITGNTLMNGYVGASGKMIFDVHPLPAGMYFVTIFQNNGSYTAKFIKAE